MSQTVTRILIISDTHARDDILIKVLKEVGSFDVLVHAGDMEGSNLLYEELAGTLPGVSYYSVAGNNDFFTDSPSVREFELPDASDSSGAVPFRVFLTHGHLFHIDNGYKEICSEAYRRGARILICGHTHVPVASYAHEIGIDVQRSASGSRFRHHNFLPLKHRASLFRPKSPSDNIAENSAGDTDLLILNPGSLSYPRQANRKYSYIILEIRENMISDYRICYLN